MGRQPQTKEPRAEGGAGFSQREAAYFPWGHPIYRCGVSLFRMLRPFSHRQKPVSDPLQIVFLPLFAPKAIVLLCSDHY